MDDVTVDVEEDLTLDRLVPNEPKGKYIANK
jgi:hypothetical protein